MVTPRTRGIVHDKLGNLTSWVHHYTPFWYIGPSLDHYRYIQCNMPATGIVIITDTLQYIPKEFAFPKTTTEDYLQQAIGDVISIMKYPSKTLLFLSYGNATKIRSIRLPTFFIEAHLNHAYKFYYRHQFYHRLRVKIFNFKIPQHTITISEGGTVFATSEGTNNSVITYTTSNNAAFRITQI